jgi:D-alanine-D-alanine ligase
MKKSDFMVAFCYNVQPKGYDPEFDGEQYAEFDSRETVETIYNSLLDLGYLVTPIEFRNGFIEQLRQLKPDLVFNIVEGFRGSDREAQAPAMYEYLGLRYTGSKPMGHALALDKTMAKRVMEHFGVRTAPFCVFDDFIESFHQPHMKFPMIVKPSCEGSSVGIDNNAKVSNKKDLIKRVNYVIETYKQPALVEQFIEGREFNQAIIGNKNPILFPIVEIDYSYLPEGIHKFSSYEVKTALDDPDSTICPANITEEETTRISEATLGAYRALGILDYARMDLRMDSDGNVYILEVNSIPGIAPGEKENNSMPKAVQVYGWTYTQMIGAIIDAALERYNISLESEETPISQIMTERYVNPTMNGK